MSTLRIRRVAVLLILFSISFSVFSRSRSEAEKNYLKGKEEVLNRKWSSAVKILETFKDKYLDSKIADAGLYWLIYSRVKAFGMSTGTEGTVMLDLALKEQNLLEQKYPQSRWMDDSRVLKVKIAMEMIERKLDGGEAILGDILEKYGESLSDSVILALDGMIRIRGEKIFHYLLEIGRPFLAQEAVFSFSRSQKGYVPFEEKPDFLDYPEDLTYPSLALKSWISWTAVMEITVNSDGGVTAVRTICGAGHDKLDKQVEQELLRCRYAPVKDDDGNSVKGRFVEIWRYKYIHKTRRWRILRWIDSSEGGIADL